MIVTRHKDTGGIYCVFFTGKMKMDDGWQDAVLYKRLSIQLKPDEDTSELYVRRLSDFKAKFELVGSEEFISITGSDIHFYNFPSPGGKFKGIFGNTSVSS